MGKRKRTPATSIDGQIKAMAHATMPELVPPAHMQLRPCDEPFWSGIIAARARDEWLECHLVTAVHLARCEADIERAQLEVDSQGSVIDNARGTPVVNPWVSVSEILARRRLALMRSLQITGRALGPADKNDTRRRVERDAKAAAREVEDESADLLG